MLINLVLGHFCLLKNILENLSAKIIEGVQWGLPEHYITTLHCQQESV